MQAVNTTQSVSQEETFTRFVVSLEFVAYLALILLALLLRVADLDIVPMNEAEAVQALPAYHFVHPDAPGDPLAATSPIVFWLQAISFSLFGGTELAARLPGVIGGLLLVLVPALFRENIGRTGALWFSLLLALLPLPFAASRFADPAIWTVILALALVWAVSRYWDTADPAAGLLAAGFGGALIFLTQPGALLLFIGLLLALLLTLFWTTWISPTRYDSPGDDLWLGVRAALGNFPWGRAALIFFGVPLLLASGFMFYPTGLSIIGETLAQTFSGSGSTSPLTIVLAYNPLLVLLSITGAVTLIRNERDTSLDRFMVAWALLAFLLLLLPAARSGWSLWLAVPLAWLTMRLALMLFENHMPIFFSGGFREENPARYWWIKWMLGIILIGVFIMISLHMQSIGRNISTFPVGGSISTLFESAHMNLRNSAFLLFFTTLLSIVGFFLAVSIWGMVNSLQGVGLGLLFFMLGSGISTGWSLTVANASNPLEIWHTSATAPDLPLLEETLVEVSRRDTLGFPALPITIVLDDESGVTDDGLLAWVVREYEDARFVDSAAAASRDEIVLMSVPADDATEPELGGSYVGQRFAVQERWSMDQLISFNSWVSWLSAREVVAQAADDDQFAILWLRIDVYEGIPADQRP